jgi:hypothetical protein
MDMRNDALNSEEVPIYRIVLTGTLVYLITEMKRNSHE